MKANLPGLALSAALAASATLSVPALGAIPSGSLSLALPGEEIPLGDRIVLFAPAESALTLQEREGTLPCPVIHASLAGDLCERGSAPAPLGGPRESHRDELSGEASTRADGLTTPEPGTAFLATLAGSLLFTVRRRTIS